MNVPKDDLSSRDASQERQNCLDCEDGRCVPGDTDREFASHLDNSVKERIENPGLSDE